MTFQYFSAQVRGLRGPGLTPQQASDLAEAVSGARAFRADVTIVRSQPTINPPGSPKVVFLTPSGRLITLIDANGYPVIHTADGPIPVPDAGRLSVSPGIVDGEAVQRFWSDPHDNVLFGYGGMGGHFSLVNGALERTNARFFAAKQASPTYAGQPWNAGIRELLSRPTGGSKVAYIFVLMGQSNADGENQNAADALISGAATYPAFALMLEGGPRIVSATHNATLVPLIENVTNQGGGVDRQRETATSGWVNHFVRDYHAAWDEYPTVVGMSVAIGGRGVIGNKQGTEAFDRLHEGVTNAATALRAQGYSDIRTVVGWIGGESDTNTAQMTGDEFKGLMRQLRRQAGDMIRRITGELSDPLFMMVQPSNALSDPWTQPVRQALVELDGEDGFVLAGPAYHYTMTGSANPADYHIHRNNMGKYSTGQQLARATMAEMLGATWHGLKPLTARWGNAAGTQIVIDCNSMGTALVEDTSGAISTAGLATKGFLFDDGSGAPPAISSVALSGLSIMITLAAKPVGPDCKIGYALARNAGETEQDGPVLGARGTIRDNAAHVRLSDNSNQFCWLPAFILRLSKP
ncbi:sialate O-acetylesterase [Sphingobium limneticum]|uniref:sialate O-acetylesterase n=1 Tax=Sphingobium limneticum TaxID=1007511 RepID=UPI003CFBE30C